VSTPIYTPVGGSIVPLTIDDVTVDRTTGATTAIGASVSASPLGTEFSAVNLTPGIATLSDNVLTPLGDGTATVDISVAAYGTRRMNVSVSDGFAYSYDTVTGYVAGSCARHIFDSITALVAGKTAGAATMDLFSSANYDTASPSGVRNTGMFAAALDLSAIGFCRTRSGVQQQWFFPAVLAKDSLSSNRFADSAYHTQVSIGDTVVFCRTDGSFQTVTVLGTFDYGPDSRLVYLSAAVTGCNAMQILPDDWETYLPVASLSGGVLPALFKGAKLPAGGSADRLRVTYAMNFGAGVMGTYGSWSDESGGPGALFPSVLSSFDSWRLPILGGDSGGSLFVPINGQPVRLGQQWQHNKAGSYLGLTAEVEAWMTGKLGAPVTLSRADLTAFNAYP
jgi:hypothetical protein